MGLLCAEQDVGNLKNMTFRNSGSSARRTRRRIFQNTHFQEFWDSCAQKKMSTISQNALSGILGLLRAEHNVGYLKKTTFQEFWDSGSQNKTSGISKHSLSGIMGRLDHGSWIQDPGYPGSWIQDPGSLVQDPGSRILDPGYWIQDPGSRMLDA